MNTTDMIEGLRAFAQHLEHLDRDPALEPQEITIAEAFRKLRLAGLTGYASIGTGAVDSFRPGEFEWGGWSVYDGASHFNGKTLFAAVTACLDAHRPKEPSPLDVIQSALNGVEAKPF